MTIEKSLPKRQKSRLSYCQATINTINQYNDYNLLITQRPPC